MNQPIRSIVTHATKAQARPFKARSNMNPGPHLSQPDAYENAMNSAYKAEMNKPGGFGRIKGY